MNTFVVCPERKILSNRVYNLDWLNGIFSSTQPDLKVLKPSHLLVLCLCSDMFPRADDAVLIVKTVAAVFHGRLETS